MANGPPRIAVAVLIVLAACSSDPTESAEYQALEAELTTVRAELETASVQLADALAENQSLRDQISSLEARVASLEVLVGTGLAADVNAEIERVCGLILDGETGDEPHQAAALVEFDPTWSAVTSSAELADHVITCAGLGYLVEVALGSEFGSESPVVHKWTHDVTVTVVGAPTAADLAAVDATVADLNRLIARVTVVRVDSAPADLVIHAVPLAEFESILPQYVPGNDGFFWISWGGGNEFTGGTILIRIDNLDQIHRNHLIREELTQTFGMMNDSYRYSDSIFQQEWTAVNDYAAIDEIVIGLLYRPDVFPGMTEADLRNTITWGFKDS
jgi:hypothetical protein